MNKLTGFINEEMECIGKFISDLKKFIDVPSKSTEEYDALDDELSIYVGIILTDPFKELNKTGLLAKLVFESSKVTFPVSYKDLVDQTNLTEEDIDKGLASGYFEELEENQLTIPNDDVLDLIDFLNILGMEEEKSII